MRYMQKAIAGILALVLCLGLAGCGGTSDRTADVSAAPAPTPAAAKEPDTPARAGRGDTDAADKEETVYVQAAPDGAVQKITVKTVLNYDGSGGEIPDKTALTDIKNLEGDEEFALKSDGTLTWEDHGERIQYEGVSGSELPVTVSITYWLDGREIDPAELPGRSGHIRVRFDYVNHTDETVTVTHADLSDEDDEDPEPPETEEVQSPIPFLAISLAMLPEDTFQNVKAENGRVFSLGDSAVVMGLAFPGLREALDLTDCELTEEVEIPDYVEFEADVTDFSLDFTATIVQNGMLEELETEDLDDLEKLTDGMDRLAEAVDEIVDGTRELSDGAGELYDGADKFAGYLAQFIDGAAQLSDGAAGLSEGLSAVNGQLAPLRTAADAAGEKLTELRGALDGTDIPVMDDTAAALEALIAAIDSFQEQLAALRLYPESVEAAVSAAEAALSGAAPDISPALEGLDLTDEQREQVYAAFDAAMSGTASAIGTARAYLDQIPDISADPQLAAYVDRLAQTADKLREQAQNALEAADELPESPMAALDTIGELLAGATALCDAIDQLDAGSSALAEGAAALASSGRALKTAANALAEGAEALHDGTVELADGMEEFRDEGISELTDKFDDSLVSLITRIRALRETDLAYDNFGGLPEGRTGSVRFIIETDAIE